VLERALQRPRLEHRPHGEIIACFLMLSKRMLPCFHGTVLEKGGQCAAMLFPCTLGRRRGVGPVTETIGCGEEPAYVVLYSVPDWSTGSVKKK